MSSRLNPREYDLGELRNAAQRSTRDQHQEREDNSRQQHRKRQNSGRYQQRMRQDTGRYHRQTESISRADDSDVAAIERAEASEFQWNNTQNAPSSTSLSRSDFELLSRLSHSGVEKPYLTRVPDSYTAQMEIFDWLDGLASKASRSGVHDALDYYESIEWLSADSRQHLASFVNGFADANFRAFDTLDMKDHRESLLYVARLVHRVDE